MLDFCRKFSHFCPAFLLLWGCNDIVARLGIQSSLAPLLPFRFPIPMYSRCRIPMSFRLRVLASFRRQFGPSCAKPSQERVSRSVGQLRCRRGVFRRSTTSVGWGLEGSETQCTTGGDFRRPVFSTSDTSGRSKAAEREVLLTLPGASVSTAGLAASSTAG